MKDTRFESMAALRAAAKDSGSHFFDRSSMKFFNSKIGTTLYKGRYFVTSEQFIDSEGVAHPRLFTIREAVVKPDGYISIDKVGEFQAYKTAAAAVAVIKTLPEAGTKSE